MKILLVNPTYHSRFDLGTSYGEPLGIAYLASVIEKSREHSVQVIDSVGLATEFVKVGGKTRIGLPEDELVKRILDSDCQVIGIALIGSLYAEEIYAFINRLKKLKPHLPIIAGGGHATLEWRDTMERSAVDCIVCGEAEGTILELLDALEGKREISGVRGIVYRRAKTGEFTVTEPRPPVPIESIPVPARHFLPMKNYFKHKPNYYFMRKPVASIFTSRACPFNCIFCNTTVFWEKKYRAHDPVRVVDEMESMIKEYGVREFSVNDDCYLADKKRVAAICDEIIKRGLDIRYQIPPGVNAALLDEELLKKLKQSGLYIIRPQFETGSAKTLRYMRKAIDLEKAKKVVIAANRLGLWTQTNVIIGFPHETRQDVEESIRFIESVGFDNVNYALPMALPHTDLREDYVASGLIKADDPLSDGQNTEYLTAVELRTIRSRAEARYSRVRLKRFLKPGYFVSEFFPKINSFEKILFLFRRIIYGLKNAVA